MSGNKSRHKTNKEKNDEIYTQLANIENSIQKQKDIRPLCKKEKRPQIQFDINEMEADHITPWNEGKKRKSATAKFSARCIITKNPIIR